jgi:hypothetical protein
MKDYILQKDVYYVHLTIESHSVGGATEPREVRGQVTARRGQQMLIWAPKVALLKRTDQVPSMSFSTLILKPLAYFGLPVYILHHLSQTSPLIRYYIRNILYVCSIGFASTVGFCAAVPLTLMGRRYDVNYIGARTFYATFGSLTGLRVLVEGEEHLETRPCVLVGNHQSMLDLLYIGRCAASLVFPFSLFSSPGQHLPKGNSDDVQTVTQVCAAPRSIHASRRRSLYRSEQ